MKRITPKILLICLAVLLLRPAGASSADEPRSAMFIAYQEGRIPPAYKGLKNPLPRDPSILDAGMHIYTTTCIACHGPDADGRGLMAEMFLPTKPANLRATLAKFPEIDDYYFWVIKNGNGAFNGPMPGYDGGLSDTEIWKIIAWMQSGFANPEKQKERQ